MFIEITQDSVGIIETSNESVQGIFTGGIQTCLIMVFSCEEATVLVHDSGQLDLTALLNIINTYGKVNKVTLAFGPQILGGHFDTRLQVILQNINLVGDVEQKQSQLPTFAFQYNVNGTSECVADRYPADVIAIPDKKLRMSCIELNNFFLEPCSQKLKPSVQYVDSKYSENFGLDYTVDEMLEILESQPEFFFPNLAFLEKAHNLQLIELPRNFLEIAQNYNVSRFMFYPIGGQDLELQKQEYLKAYEIA
ncbi:hypothetical protein ACEV8A_24110 [Vibrio parahaemolyticus]|uniref:hypothetical protein n=1 Tax=Vibrio parahaemolyticus TaxID=670 RepID=UPI0003F73CAC|nr:hypothetical protein [Vibrio parahaemolyticus]ELA9846550.1 hypothetical protein [Vibrio parahaemolyticus]MBE3858285.1 hypothetical protein [Vibrio parahaemolyticus]MBE4804579.1 hypothetical protein [Vibrio parahaemolyticus]MCX8951481.1 hypothetical protein [Vibrio parahaemolyticus]OKY36826.1 hypothetical protein BT101_24515 [Vibrio parahaemolyticus]